MTANERELLQLCDTPQTVEFMIKVLNCALTFGDAFFEEIRPHLERDDIDGILAIVNREGQT